MIIMVSIRRFCFGSKKFIKNFEERIKIEKKVSGDNKDLLRILSRQSVHQREKTSSNTPTAVSRKEKKFNLISS